MTTLAEDALSLARQCAEVDKLRGDARQRAQLAQASEEVQRSCAEAREWASAVRSMTAGDRVANLQALLAEAATKLKIPTGSEEPVDLQRSLLEDKATLDALTTELRHRADERCRSLLDGVEGDRRWAESLNDDILSRRAADLERNVTALRQALPATAHAFAELRQRAAGLRREVNALLAGYSDELRDVMTRLAPGTSIRLDHVPPETLQELRSSALASTVLLTRG